WRARLRTGPLSRTGPSGRGRPFQTTTTSSTRNTVSSPTACRPTHGSRSSSTRTVGCVRSRFRSPSLHRSSSGGIRSAGRSSIAVASSATGCERRSTRSARSTSSTSRDASLTGAGGGRLLLGMAGRPRVRPLGAVGGRGLLLLVAVVGLGLAGGIAALAANLATPIKPPPTVTTQFGYIKSLVLKGGRYQLKLTPAFFLVGDTANAAAVAAGEIKPGQG